MLEPQPHHNNHVLCPRADNPALWLEFVQFQDKAHRVHEKRSMRKVVLEKKMAIFERALKYNSGSEQLIAAHLDLCCKHVDIAEVPCARFAIFLLRLGLLRSVWLAALRVCRRMPWRVRAAACTGRPEWYAHLSFAHCQMPL